MIAVILAAGRGSRLGALTDDRPKCLVSLAGKPLISWQVNALRVAGAQKIIVVGGYRGDALSQFSDVLIRNERWETTNMVSSLRLAREYLKSEPCVISYSDIVYHSDIPTALMRAEGEVAISFDRDWLSLWSLRFDDPKEDAEKFEYDHHCLTRIGGRAKSLDEINGQYMGLIKTTPRGWQSIEETLKPMTSSEIDRLDMTSLLSIMLGEGRTIEVVPTDGRWCEVDSTTDLEKYEEELRKTPNGARWRHDWRQ
jgi:choline kinase